MIISIAYLFNFSSEDRFIHIYGTWKSTDIRCTLYFINIKINNCTPQQLEISLKFIC